AVYFFVAVCLSHITFNIFVTVHLLFYIAVYTFVAVCLSHIVVYIVRGMAAFIVPSSVASAAVNAAVTRPSVITSILLDTANISGSSDDTMMIPMPEAARPSMILYIS